MTRDDFVSKFKVGDKVRYNDMDDNDWLEVIFIGDQSIFCKTALGTETIWYFGGSYYLTYAEPQEQKKTVKMAQAVLSGLYKDHCFLTQNFYSSKEKIKGEWSLNTIIQWPLVINGEEQWITVEVEE